MAMSPNRQFFRSCRQRLFRLKVGDWTGVQLTGGKLLAGTLLLRRLLSHTGVVRSDSKDNMVGILLPPSAGAALANLAIAISGNISVNLNYSFDNETLRHCVDQCGITHVLTSRKFLKKRPFELDAQLVFLEDLKQEATWLQKLIAASQAYLLPGFVLERLLGLSKSDPDDVFTILFTSGTTGNPKGVKLSHANVAASYEVIRERYLIHSTDVTLGILPFFHAFGFAATLWLPMATNMAVVYHFDPFGTKAIGKLAKQFRATVLFATPTFLKLYLRRCQKEDLATLDLAVVGAEKLDAELAQAFSDKFGATPVEGYGATELSPWAAVNVPTHRSRTKGFDGIRPGTVGRALNHVEVKVVDPDSKIELQPGEPGLLLVSGPNVMLGYLNNPEKTAEVVQDGWYDTGDFAKIDRDGFISITGRQSRFSKIGGEMVPHRKIEKLIARVVLGDEEESTSDPVVAVTAIADAKKGERLFVIYVSLGDHTADEVAAELAARGLPNLWIPRPVDFIAAAEIPLTSVGKVDLAALKRIAKEAVDLRLHSGSAT